MTKKNRLSFLIIAGGFFFLLDQTLKYLALYVWVSPRLVSPSFGWQVYTNPGVAFGLPLPNWLTLLISLSIIALAGFLASKEYRGQRALPLFGWILLLAGAISNVIDRIVYQNVVDYFVIGTALMNLSDIMIMAGLVIYISSHRKRG